MPHFADDVLLPKWPVIQVIVDTQENLARHSKATLKKAAAENGGLLIDVEVVLQNAVEHQSEIAAAVWRAAGHRSAVPRPLHSGAGVASLTQPVQYSRYMR